MTEQQNQDPTLDVVPDPPAADPPADPPARRRGPKADPAPDEPKYAVYDTTLLRFVGPVFGSKADATDARKASAKAAGRKVSDFDVKEV